MSKYSDYTININLKSPIATPLQSDTIFGHICWAIHFLKWDEDDRLNGFLSLFNKDNTQPPMLVSNGFPKGYLPKPIIPPVTQEDLKEVYKNRKSNRVENSFKIKAIKKTDIISKSNFNELQKGMITSRKLFAVMDDSFNDIQQLKEKEESMLIQHNTINRISGTVKEGVLFAQEETFFNERHNVFEMYLKTNCFSKEDLLRIFEFIGSGGFGRDKSTGKGHFEFEIAEGIKLPESNNPNAFMTLSSFIPKEDDPTAGYYNILHKYGKLGGTYAKGIPVVGGNPFKVPLMMFAAGSVFKDKEYKPGKVYGSLLSNVHKHNNEIKHYAYAFPIGIYIEE